MKHQWLEEESVPGNEYTGGLRVVCSCGWKGPERHYYSNAFRTELNRDMLLHEHEVSKAAALARASSGSAPA